MNDYGISTEVFVKKNVNIIYSGHALSFALSIS